MVGLEEISATHKYIPVFGKSLQPKQKAPKTDSIQEEGLYDQTTKSIISSLEVNEHETDAIEIKMMVCVIDMMKDILILKPTTPRH